MNAIRLTRNGNVTTLDLPAVRVVISYSNHELSHDPESLPPETLAVFLEGPSNFLAQPDRARRYINHYTYGVLAVDVGAVLKRAQGLGLDLISADPDVNRSLLDNDTRWLWVWSGMTALGIGGTICGMGKALSKGMSAQTRRRFLGAGILGCLATAYMSLPVLGVGGRVLTSRHNIGHSATATLMRANELCHPGSMQHLLRLRNAVVAYKVLWYADRLRARSNIDRPTLFCPWGACHSGFESDLQKTPAELLRYIADFGNPLSPLFSTPETLHALLINHTDGTSERLDCDELRRLLLTP